MTLGRTTDPTVAWALVPVKPLEQAKSRLADVLSPRERQALQRAMLSDVLAGLSHARRLTGVAVIGTDEHVAAISAQYGAQFVPEGEAPRGLNAALAVGSQAIRGVGATLIAIIPADVPGLDPVEIERAVFHADANRATVAVPDRQRFGTNALVFHAEAPPVFQFGEDSFRRHLSSGGTLPAVPLSLPSLALDVDSPADLEALAQSKREVGAHTRALLSMMRQAAGGPQKSRSSL